jgi:hypothetical protein
MFQKAKEFTEELLKENERLRFKIASLEATVGGGPPTLLDERVRELEQRLLEVETRYHKVEEENKEFADRYIEIEEQNNNLANLYVASYQLHSTLDYKEVVRIVQEIVINLIGAEAFHLFMVSDKTGQLDLETRRGQRARDHHRHRWSRRLAAKTGENFAAQVAHKEATPFDQPTAVIPSRSRTASSASSPSTSSGPEDGVHAHRLRATLLAGMLPPPSSRPSCIDLRASSRRCRASST